MKRRVYKKKLRKEVLENCVFGRIGGGMSFYGKAAALNLYKLGGEIRKGDIKRELRKRRAQSPPLGKEN